MPQQKHTLSPEEIYAQIQRVTFRHQKCSSPASIGYTANFITRYQNLQRKSRGNIKNCPLFFRFMVTCDSARRILAHSHRRTHLISRNPGCPNTRIWVFCALGGIVAVLKSRYLNICCDLPVCVPAKRPQIFKVHPFGVAVQKADTGSTPVPIADKPVD